MAEQQTEMTMSPDELRTFAGKLQRWGQALNPKEQRFLAEVLGRAATAEVQGFAAPGPFFKILPEIGPGSAAWHKGEGPFLKIDSPFLKIDSPILPPMAR